MDWLENKPIGYKIFFNDNMINQLMKDSIINEWIEYYLQTDTNDRPDFNDIFEYNNVRKLSIFHMADLILLFDNIKDLPSITKKDISIFKELLNNNNDNSFPEKYF
jgi:hypothetical protein